MESNIHSYELKQRNNTYIVRTSVVGEEIKISCKSKTDSTFAFTRNFTLETFKRVGSLFESFQTAVDAVKFIDRTMRTQKVKIVQEGSLVKLVLYIIDNGTKHNVQIPLSEGGQINTKIESSTFNIETSTNVKFDTSAIATGEVMSTNVDTTNTFGTGEVMGTNVETTNTFTTGEVMGTNVDTTNTFTTGEVMSTNIDTTNTFTTGEVMGTNVDTTNTFTTGEVMSTNVDTSNAFTTGEVMGTNVDTANAFTSGEVMSTNVDTANAFTTGEVMSTNVDTTNTFTTEEGKDTNFDITTFNTNEVIGTQSQFVQLGETATTTTTTTTEVNFSREIGLDPAKIVKQTINPDTQEIIKSIEDEKKLRLSQVGKVSTESSNINIPDNTQLQPTLEKFNFDQLTSTSVEGSLTQTDNTATNVVPEITPQNITTQDTATQFNFDEYQTTVSTRVDQNIPMEYTEPNIQTQNIIDTTPVAPVTTDYGTPFISPADEMTTTPTEIKMETTPVNMTFGTSSQNYNNEINFDQYQTTTATTTTTTQFDTQNVVQDDRLVKLEGDTNSLKNEHQQIQNKLTTLYNQVNSYKTQLEKLQSEKNSRELSMLRAENAAIKQQLSELNNLRTEAAQINLLRNQVAEMDPLRRKAAELDSLRSQLNELNMLKMKVAELSGMQNQLGELNNLKAQINQMNMAKQQKSELEEKEALQRKLQELETLKSEYEQEIRTLKGTKSSVVQDSSVIEKKEHLFEDKTRQISVKGDIIHNTEELEFITRKINKSNKKITLNLLYKASVDSDKAAAFHEKCDKAESSLVLVETDKGKRFGGFTTCSWSGDCEEKKDEDAFIFSLDNMAIYENIPGEEAIGCYPKFGPIFLGCQIRIYDNAFSKGGTTFEKGLNYNTEEDYELTGGDRIFNVKEIEVYEVIAQ